MEDANGNVVSRHKIRPFEENKQKVFINLDNVIAVELLGDRTSILFVNGGTETLETAPDEVIEPYQVSGHAPLI